MNEKVLAIVRPPNQIIKVIKASSEEDIDNILEPLKGKNLLLFSSSFDPTAQLPEPELPWELEYDCSKLSPPIKQLPLKPTIIVEKDQPPSTESIICPYCHKVLSSLSGRTLHIKHKHPEMETA